MSVICSNGQAGEILLKASEESLNAGESAFCREVIYQEAYLACTQGFQVLVARP